MENNPQMQALLEKIEVTNRQQLLFTKILCVLCALAVICSAVIMVTVCQTASALTTLVTPLRELAGQAEVVLKDLGTAANKLAQSDFSGIAGQIDTLVADSQTALAEAMKKIDTIDIDTLNKAIKDLAVAAEPLAKLGKLFG